MENKKWEPTPQPKPFKEEQEELRIGILPDSPLPREKPKSPYDMGEGVDITPANYNEHIGDDEEEN